MNVPKITRKELYDMTTSQLYKLSNELMKLDKIIKSELVCRGDF